MQNNNEINVTADQALQQAFTDFNAQVNPGNTPATETPATETGTPEVTPTQQDSNQTNPSNQAFAKMRTDLAAVSKQLSSVEAALKQQGYASVEDYLTKQQESRLTQQAQQQGISPELEKRIQTLEQENEKYRQNERMGKLKTEVGALVKKYSIDQEGWSNFISKLQASNINPLATDVPLETLYIQHNLEYIFNKRLEQEKQSWLQAQTNAAQSAPISTPQGTPPAAQGSKRNVNWADMANSFNKSKN